MVAARGLTSARKQPTRSILFATAFRRVVIGEGLSSFGTQLAIIAVPSFALRQLGASAADTAYIYAFQWLPPLVLGLFAGRLADTRWQFTAMMAADFFAAAASVAIAVLMWQGLLSLATIYVLTAASAAAGTFFALGSAALLPNLLSTGQRGAGNASLAVARSLADASAQLSAARLIGVASGALVVLIDGFTFLLRALLVLSVWRIGQAAQRLAIRAERAPGELTHKQFGFRILRRNPRILKLLVTQAVISTGGGVIVGLFLVYAYRDLRLAPWHITVMLATGNIAGLLGALAYPSIARAIGVHIVGLGGLTLWISALWLIPVAESLWPFVTLLCYETVFGFSSTLCLISIATQRQNATPSRYQGQVAGWSVSLGYAAMITGAVGAAGLASVFPPRIGILIGCGLSSAAVLCLMIPDRFYAAGLPPVRQNGPKIAFDAPRSPIGD